MFYKAAWIGIFGLVIIGTVYLGTKGITVAKRSVQVEIPMQRFIK